MKLDILKTSLLAVVFAFGCNSLVLAICQEHDDDDCHNPRTRHSHLDDCGGIEDRTAAMAQQRAGTYVTQFNSGIALSQTAALKGLYGMLRMEDQDSKMAAGHALLVIIQKNEPAPQAL